MYPHWLPGVTPQSCAYCAVQVLVDIGTPCSVFEAVEAELKKFVTSNPDFSGGIAVAASNSANPMKFTLAVWYEFSFNSESPLGWHTCLHAAGLKP